MVRCLLHGHKRQARAMQFKSQAQQDTRPAMGGFYCRASRPPVLIQKRARLSDLLQQAVQERSTTQAIRDSRNLLHYSLTSHTKTFRQSRATYQQGSYSFRQVFTSRYLDRPQPYTGPPTDTTAATRPSSELTAPALRISILLPRRHMLTLIICHSLI